MTRQHPATSQLYSVPKDTPRAAATAQQTKNVVYGLRVANTAHCFTDKWYFGHSHNDLKVVEWLGVVAQKSNQHLCWYLLKQSEKSAGRLFWVVLQKTDKYLV